MVKKLDWVVLVGMLVVWCMLLSQCVTRRSASPDPVFFMNPQVLPTDVSFIDEERK